MSEKDTSIKTLELYAEELPAQVDLATVAGTASTASSFTTASCPATTASTAGSASSYG
ncbi:thiocillin family RiPP [Bacillus atrophaeus]|uniref:Thiocillin family RiPP n=1 Tax=Bacillus atrophaeus (strain 1942) TaxID=720555 RepID=A0ABM5M0P0_BACA1|nr:MULTISPECIES: thiocillin family RiPP [Bacillus]MBT2627011.1 thiocillin family RiPP [Bacillus sp. ISL-32]ADP33739.1 hypothetical protein BATR1942_14085 [Bacillus atrophaeus 1942]AIK48580.1 hypothetical protein DJ95_2717 [Bacillus atrophaeus subsp. globigii]ARW08189.1 hypothetical protein S101359_03210 [Bacillus atrophaeus]EIM10697.1 hypothetical protein UY9_10792 [Bacillus atrophaeus C89]